MRISYDSSKDIIQIVFQENVASSKDLGGGIKADYDAEGNLSGISVPGGKKLMGEKVKEPNLIFNFINLSGTTKS